ncbi:MAG: ABC transporter permease [Acidobacteriota bacterium]
MSSDSSSRGTPAARLHAVRVTFGDVEALRDVDLAIYAGEITVLAGPNGSGKSTALRLLSGLLDPEAGQVEILGVRLDQHRESRDSIRPRLTYLSQRPALDPELKGREILNLLATLYGLDGSTRRRRLAHSIEAHGLGDFVDRRTAGYSGGQKRRLHLAGSMLHSPDLILLDEPEAGLDRQGRKRLWRELRRRALAGAAVVIVSHDHGAAADHADRVIELEDGRVREEHRQTLATDHEDGAGEARLHLLKTRGLASALRIGQRAWIKTLRRPVTLTFSLAQPLIWMGFFGFLFERYQLVELEPLSYLDFLAPGVCAMTVLFGASQAGATWIRDLHTGFLQRLLQTPASPHALLAGKIGADVLRLLLQAAAVLVLALLLGARLETSWLSVLASFPALLFFAVAFSSLSCAIALKARAQEAMATFIHLVNMPMLFTSTALVPARQMPPWLEGIAALNPLTLAVDAWRGALLHDQLPRPGSLAILAVLALVLYWVAARLMASIRGLS